MSPKTQADRTRRLVVLSLLAAIAYGLAVATHFLPGISVSFLKYDPKSVVVAFGAFLHGPVAGLLLAVVVAVLELVTGISDTGLIGLVMNILTTAGFACFSALVYTKKRTLGGAILGLSVGVLATTALMLLWNYLVTPLYMTVPREVVAGMLLPLFLPFNLIQGVINMALTLLLYSPLVTALRAAKLLPSGRAVKRRRTSVAVFFGAGFLFVTALLVLLAWSGAF